MAQLPNQDELVTKAVKHYDAFSVPQAVKIVTSFGEFRSEAAIFEVVRLMKLDVYTYGSLFCQSISEVG